jgi:hypothetical protein
MRLRPAGTPTGAARVRRPGLCRSAERILPLDELKKTLIDDATPRAVRDAVWRELVTRARRDGPGWVVAAVGIAMPGLQRTARLLARGWHGDYSDLDAELLSGFLHRLNTVLRRRYPDPWTGPRSGFEARIPRTATTRCGPSSR